MENAHDENWKMYSGRGRPGPEPKIPKGVPHTKDRKTLTTQPLKNMYLVGRLGKEYGAWEFQGIFSAEELADNACIYENYFYMEVGLDKEFPHDTVAMDNILFPRREIQTQSYQVVCPVHGAWCTTYRTNCNATTCPLCGSELTFEPIYQ